MGNKVFVLYHANCRDGFAAAWAAWKRFGDEATYIACGYGQELPEMPDWSSVYIVDFSFPREVLLTLEKRMNKVTVLDHHETAMKDLEGLPQLYDIAHDSDLVLCVTFDMDKSGATLAWEYFHHDKPLPTLIKHIEDRDLWRFNFPETEAFCAYMNTLEKDFKVWDDVAERVEHVFGFTHICTMGDSVLSFIKKEVERMCKGCKVVDFERFDLVVNATAFFSEVGHQALEAEPLADFSVSYGDNFKAGMTIFSLRSRTGSDIHVGEIASQWGGGGHKHAASFKLPSDHDDLKHIFGGIK